MSKIKEISGYVLFLCLIIASCVYGANMFSIVQTFFKADGINIAEHLVGIELLAEMPPVFYFFYLLLFYSFVLGGITLYWAAIDHEHNFKKFATIGFMFLAVSAFFYHKSYAEAARAASFLVSSFVLQCLTLILACIWIFRKHGKALFASTFLSISLFPFVFIAPFVLQQSFVRAEKLSHSNLFSPEWLKGSVADVDYETGKRIQDIYYKGSNFFWKGEFEKACEHFKRARSYLKEKDANYYPKLTASMAHALYRLGKKEESNRMLEKLLLEGREHTSYWFACIHVWLSVGEKRRAFHAYNEAAKRFQNEPYLAYLEFYFLNDKKEFQTVIEKITNLEKRREAFYSGIYREVAYAYFKTGHESRGVDYLKQYCCRRSDFWYSDIENKDNLLAGKVLSALHIGGKDRRHDRSYTWRDYDYFNWKLTIYRNHNVKEAENFIEAELAKKSKEAYYYNIAAKFYIREGNLREAIKVYEQHLSIKPENKKIQEEINELKKRLSSP